MKANIQKEKKNNTDHIKVDKIKLKYQKKTKIP